MKQISIKPGKEKAIQQKHHWIFSGAIASIGSFEDGEILPVYTAKQDLLGYAMCNRHGSIRARMISFGSNDPLTNIRKEMQNAISMRAALFKPNLTNGYRLINGEGDRLPGLIVDKYNDYLVVQIGNAGIEKIRDSIVKWLIELTVCTGIFEKSKMPSRREEKLPEVEQWLYGEEKEEVEIIENGLRFIVPIVKGQKTGFFLDQREMREYIEFLSNKRRVLNCFSYTGGFSLYALRGGANSVTSVDISQHALQVAQKQVLLNGFNAAKHTAIQADVFEYLRENTLDYDLVILDPPAFVKKKADVIKGCRGYKEINRVTLEKMPAGSMLLTSSCSYYVDPELFQQVIFQAANEANRQVKIIGRHIHAPDHPINLFHKEGEYLKSLLLFVE